jgi:uncharacterized membrane protein YdjX (TVP38/TMEM64 family)
MGWLRFFSSWDARAWRAAGATIALFLAVAGVLLLGKSALGAEAVSGVEHWLERARGSGLGLPATVLAFTVAAFIGVPQFLLIAAAVLAFGPAAGFAYSWIATVVSAAVTFWVGRLIGARSLERFGGGALQRISRFVGRNAFVGSMVIRNVPSAPFIVVNMAFGVSSARFWPAAPSGCCPRPRWLRCSEPRSARRWWATGSGRR